MTRTFFLLLFLFFLKSEYVNSQVIINEFVASNVENTINPTTQEFDDWIELYNTSGTEINLTGYFLTDNLLKPTKWQFPVNTIIQANSYLIVWANNLDYLLNSNFSLSAAGEEIGLFSPTLLLLDSVAFGQQLGDVSFGRKTDGAIEKVFFNPASFKSSNSSSNFFLGIAEKPIFINKSGFYNAPTTVEISKNTSGDPIYYTTDNSTPNQLSKLYTTPISISKNTNIRAVSIKENYLNSYTLSQSFFIDETKSDLNTWSIITDSVNLYGDIGIYSHPWTDGLECDVDNIFIKNNALAVTIKSGLRIQGGNSVGMPKKSFREFYRSRLGNEYLNYKLFTNTNLSYFKNIVLRAGYDDDLTDYYGTLLRDPLSSDMWRKSGALTSMSDWSILYLNMEYWGIYNLRESVNEYFIEHHTGLTNFELIRYQKTGSDIKFGDGSEWQKLTSFINSTDFSVESSFYDAAEFIDMDNFINLLSFVHCSQYRSWTWGSSAYKDYSANGKWRWTIWDTDRAYSDLNWNGFTEYQYTSNEKWGNFMPQALIKNSIFKNKLINRTADLLNTIFLSENSISTLDSLANKLDSEIPREIDRWTSTTYDTWQSRVQNLRTFLTNRPATVRNQILTYFSLNSTQEITLAVEGQGYIQINTIKPASYPWSGIYFEGVEIELTAFPENGYKFANWTDNNSSTTMSIKLLPENYSEITAIFIEDPTANNDKEIVINEINYNSSVLFDTKDWVELYNPNKSNINLDNWLIKDNNPLNQFIFKPNTIIEAENFLIICKDTIEFKRRFPEVKNYTGNILFGFGTSDEVKIYNSNSELVDFVSYNSSAPWSEFANGTGASLELISPEKENELAENWNAYIDYYGTPGNTNRSLTIHVPSIEKKQILIYPNPVKDFLFINLENQEDSKIRIFDMNGKLQFTENLILPNSKIDLTFLNNGVYFIQIITKKTVETHKIIKQQ